MSVPWERREYPRRVFPQDIDPVPPIGFPHFPPADFSVWRQEVTLTKVPTRLLNQSSQTEVPKRRIQVRHSKRKLRNGGSWAKWPKRKFQRTTVSELQSSRRKFPTYALWAKAPNAKVHKRKFWSVSPKTRLPKIKRASDCYQVKAPKRKA